MSTATPDQMVSRSVEKGAASASCDEATAAFLKSLRGLDTDKLLTAEVTAKTAFITELRVTSQLWLAFTQEASFKGKRSSTTEVNNTIQSNSIALTNTNVTFFPSPPLSLLL